MKIAPWKYLRSIFFKKIQIDNHNFVNYSDCKYAICATKDDTWKAIVTLFSDNVESKFFTFSLNFSESYPEILFFYLQLIGPFFNHTNEEVLVYDKNGNVIHTWNLTKGLSEQGIELEVQFQKHGFGEDTSNSVIINDGPTSLN